MFDNNNSSTSPTTVKWRCGCLVSQILGMLTYGPVYIMYANVTGPSSFRRVASPSVPMTDPQREARDRHGREAGDILLNGVRFLIFRQQRKTTTELSSPSLPYFTSRSGHSPVLLSRGTRDMACENDRTRTPAATASAPLGGGCGDKTVKWTF